MANGAQGHGPTSPYDKLPSVAVDELKYHYKDLIDSWRSIDTKAQGLAAFSGLFLTGLFTWAKEPPQWFTSCDRWILGVCTVLLLATIALALWALWLKKTEPPPSEAITKMVKDILADQSEPDKDGAVVRFYSQQLGEWQAAIKDIESHLATKALVATWGQGTIAVTGLLFGLLIVRAIIFGGGGQ